MKKLKQFDIHNPATKTHPNRQRAPSGIPTPTPKAWQPNGGSDTGSGSDDGEDDSSGDDNSGDDNSGDDNSWGGN